MSSQSLMPQLFSMSISLTATLVGAFFLQSSLPVLGKFSSLVFPAVLAIELFKFFLTQQCYQLPGNLSTSSSGSKSNNTNPTLLNRIKDFTKSILIFALATFLFACAAIILGAPLFSKFEETISLSLILTTLTVLPLQLFVGTRHTLVALLTGKLDLGKLVAEQHLDFLQCAGLGAIMGAWSSSVVMPLDWDRPYQVYPVPNVVGAVGGHLLGCGFFVLKTILFNAKAELKKKSIL